MSCLFYLCESKFDKNMVSSYSLVLLLLKMMIVTTVVGAGRSNMIGYPDYNLSEIEDEWFHLFCDPHDIIMAGKRVRFACPPPTFVPEEDLWDFDSFHWNLFQVFFIVNLYN